MLIWFRGPFVGNEQRELDLELGRSSKSRLRPNLNSIILVKHKYSGKHPPSKKQLDTLTTDEVFSGQPFTVLPFIFLENGPPFQPG